MSSDYERKGGQEGNRMKEESEEDRGNREERERERESMGVF